MNKIIVILCFLILGIGYSSPAITAQLPNVQLKMRDYEEIEIPAGTFIPVLNTQEISTQYCSEGYKVKFVSTNDLYMYETNIIPRDTTFYGYIEKMNEPVIGTNASLRVKITKLVLADGYELPVKGFIYNSNDNMFGGGLSEPAEWVKMPHIQKRYGTTLQLKPGARRQMGIHTTIAAGESLLIVLTDSAFISHTVTN